MMRIQYRHAFRPQQSALLPFALLFIFALPANASQYEVVPVHDWTVGQTGWTCGFREWPDFLGMGGISGAPKTEVLIAGRSLFLIPARIETVAGSSIAAIIAIFVGAGCAGHLRKRRRDPD